ncbi:S8 family peptidase [Clostridium manihotivorum]|uniref:S8 family peptidase n=1 Tax=Clostridium manihotivorum TaxID=2320868 RepID=UPI001EE5A5B9|nr:S8 family peptidase [Clostridium manihotivorum]
MDTGKFDATLNLLTNVPNELVGKLSKISENETINQGSIEVVVLFGDNVDKVVQSVDKIGGKLENLGFGFGIVTIKAVDINRISELQGVQYAELPKVLFTSDINSNRAACVPQVYSEYNSTGAGVLVGFIDTGIDYTHPAFRNADGTTRIDYIYDLSTLGKVYDRNTINQALRAQNPLSIVDITDPIGHGTHVAGIACAGGNINRQYYGVAYESSIAMVKTTRYGFANYALSTQIMRGIRFLIDKSAELNKPLVINISLSTNDGAHNGTSLFEQYIQTVCTLERVAIVIAAGNEGEAAHHVGGELREQISIGFTVSEGEPRLSLQLYKPLLSNLSIVLTTPSGVRSGDIVLSEGYKDVTIGGNRCLIYNTGPRPFDISGEIIISFVPVGENISPGEWTLTIKTLNQYRGLYDIWMPITEGLNPNTRFLQPNVYNTLGIPATVEAAISVGSYDYKTNNLSPFSGRGRLLNVSFNKPDLSAPGEGILSSVEGGGFDSKSGTSMAAPHVAGICALLLQWGVVKGNDPFLFGDRLKYYLMRAAKRERTDVTYPNPSWGYGTVCADNTFSLLKASQEGRLYQLSDDYRQENIEQSVTPNSPQNQPQQNAILQNQQPGTGSNTNQVGNNAQQFQQNTTGTTPNLDAQQNQGQLGASGSTGIGFAQQGQTQGAGLGQQITGTNNLQGNQFQVGQTVATGQGEQLANTQGATGSAGVGGATGLTNQPITGAAGQTGTIPVTPQIAQEGGPNQNPQISGESNLFLDPNYRYFAIEYQGDIKRAISSYPDADVLILDEFNAVLVAPINRVFEIAKNVPEVVNLDTGRLYTLSALSPVEASQAPLFHNNVYLPLDGSGVIIGIVDSGIDYLNEEFIREDDTSRVVRIWDQTVQTPNEIPIGFPFGTEYTEQQLNTAIKAKRAGSDPYAIVPSRDEIGHGTHMAGIAAARGKNPALVGAAPGSDLAIVKLKEAPQGSLDYFYAYGQGRGRYGNVDVLLGVKYLYNLALQLRRPMVIYIPLGTNLGSHDGNSSIERYIDEVSKIRGIIVVTTVGNQGEADNHTTGTLTKNGDSSIIELRIGQNQRNILIDIWVGKPDKYSLSIVSPSGEIIQRIPPRLNQAVDVNFVYERTKMNIEYFIPENTTGDERILIRAENIREGIWQFKIIGDLVVSGRYDAYLLQKELLAPDTKFLSGNQYTTLTPPATSRRIISVAYYNQNNNATVGESGRGYTRDNRIKPDIAAGGINALTTDVGGGTVTISGASVAGAVTAGCCAILLQWGVVEKNDPTMYAANIKTYLYRGATKREGDVYPNPQWGYGMLNMKGVFDNIRSVINMKADSAVEVFGQDAISNDRVVKSRNGERYDNNTHVQDKDFIEYNKGNLLIRIPRRGR